MNEGLFFQLDAANVGRILVVNKHTNAGLADIFELSDLGFDRHNVKIKFFYAFLSFFHTDRRFSPTFPIFSSFSFVFLNLIRCADQIFGTLSDEKSTSSLT